MHFKQNLHLLLLASALFAFTTSCHDHHTHDEGTKDETHDKDHDHDKDHAHDKGAAEKEHEHEPGEIIFSPEQAKAGGVETETVVPGEFHGVIRVSGQIRSAQADEITVVATTNGTVTWDAKGLAEGMAVAAGSTIVHIASEHLLDGDPTEKAKNAFEVARSNYQRAKLLLKDSILSVKQFEEIEMQYKNARIAYKSLGNKATSRGISVTCPMSGFVKNIAVSNGSYVSTGQPIATISRNRKLQLVAYLPESYFAQSAQIKGANFRTSYDNRLYKLDELNGRLLASGKSADVANGFLPIAFEFDNRGTVIPGTYADIYLTTQSMPQTITVPLTAITEDQGVYFVYVREEEDAYKRCEVQAGMNDGERMQILSGLEAGQNVVVKGAYLIKLAANSSVIPEGHSHNH